MGLSCEAWACRRLAIEAVSIPGRKTEGERRKTEDGWWVVQDRRWDRASLNGQCGRGAKNMESISVTVYFKRLCGGDSTHVAGLMSHFFPRMRGLAQRVLGQIPLPVLDASDVAQSAFVSFWQRAERGDFAQQADRNDLWRLLATITVRKARRHIGREMSEKRGGGRVLNESALSDADGQSTFAELARDVSTEAMDMTVEELIDSLGAAELRQVALFKLMAYTNGEIAEMLNCSERKIERKLRLIRAAWSHTGDGMEQS